MKYIATLADLSELDADADEITVQAGALVFSTEGIVTLVIAPRVWRSVRRPTMESLPAPPAKPAQKPMTVPPPLPDPMPYRR